MRKKKKGEKRREKIKKSTNNRIAKGHILVPAGWDWWC